MIIINIGISYEKAPLEVREKMSVDLEQQKYMSSILQEEKAILENVVLSTCNRTEIFAVVDQLHTGRYYLKRFLSDYFKIDMEELNSYLDIYEDEWALHHLYLLSCGLKSSLKGETEITGQLKRAYEQGLKIGSTGSIFNYLFQNVFRYSKYIRTEFSLDTENRSVCSQVSRLLNQDTNLHSKNVMIIGLGEIGTLMYRYCQELPINRLFLVNRSYYKAVNLSKDSKLDTQVVPYSEFPEYLKKVDYLITAVTSPKQIIDNTNLVREDNSAKSLTCFDLGMPRNIENTLESKNVNIINIDTINQIMKEESIKINEVEKFVEKDAWNEINSFYKWQGSLGAVELIQDIRNKQLMHLETVEKSLHQKLPELDDRSQKVINKHLKSLVNSMLKEPIKQIKDLSVKENSENQLSWIRRLFGVNERSETESRIPRRTIRVGTRGSQLALTQTKQVVDELNTMFPEYRFEIVTIQTYGDKDQTSSLSQIGGKGVFIKKIEEKLGKNVIDLAVHSCKDMPARLLKGTCLAGIPKRQEVNDIVLFRDVEQLSDLLPGSIVGTGSSRRRKQLQRQYPQFIFKDIRGNIDTRIQKMYDNEYDAIILAKAGLNRLNYLEMSPQIKYQILSLEQSIPAIAQGALGLQCRADDKYLIEMVEKISDPESFDTVQVERKFLELLGADCTFPIGGYAHYVDERHITMTAFVGRHEDDVIFETTQTVELKEKNKLAQKVFDQIQAQKRSWKCLHDG